MSKKPRSSRPRSRRAKSPNPDMPAELRDDNHGIRIQKAMADAGVASRRACEQMIEEGRVAVNGVTVRKLPIWVDPQTDRITLDDRPVARPKKTHRYLLVNKPRNIICTTSDEFGRRDVTDLVPHNERLFCVGRLDADSQGMVILTDDGDLTQKLTHPSHEVPKTYAVTVKGEIAEQDMAKLQRGVVLSDKSGKTGRASPDRVQVLSRDRDRTKLMITLTEGRNREIRRILARFGYNVHRLQRVAIGPVKLKGVGVGQWRDLSATEVNMLRKAAR